METIVIVGGTGAQGSAVVQQLSDTNKFKVLVLTRSTTSPPAQEIAALPNVELIVGNASFGYDLEAFYKAAQQSQYAFINTDGFALGEQAETYFGIRLFELSLRAGVKHFIYSGLDYNGKKSGYDPTLYVGHYEGKARVQEFMRAQPNSSMARTVINSGPYIEMLQELLLPEIGNDGVARFKLPIGHGAVPFIHLDDFARYVPWILEHPEESNGIILGIATAHVSGPELAAAFTAVTKRQAEYIDQPNDKWIEAKFGHLPNGVNTKVGALSVKDPKSLLMTYGENFSNWWNLYKASADNKGLIQRDYGLLDRILPDRVKSVEDWMRKVDYDGTHRSVLKSEGRVQQPPSGH
ncbi:hypothetical protein LTR10_017714 [Elasticomyces elasticus]|uniref:NmrA-like domain-containing protein n=1 Tax=Exophiala sideris TaxID=1016849 RepID=A0ABR0JCA5_9EURO|nr:hypothetical protein LTR10_017714 [Elasticomyces elasticus]KAK5031037.1 hypothetical protein LTS07_004772 [Exophiala sideris]KAK5038759.1 hypothetical protein LTR13_003790 [Exophiala sideris]KAK5060642.1 hypothetical protein LTR69_005241 [Exophiala sideris]KAK5183555.1 hypothetical protein LTR44_003837 [Eurotiomycetes sp. CCFEE 6388]